MKKCPYSPLLNWQLEWVLNHLPGQLKSSDIFWWRIFTILQKYYSTTNSFSLKKIPKKYFFKKSNIFHNFLEYESLIIFFFHIWNVPNLANYTYGYDHHLGKAGPIFLSDPTTEIHYKKIVKAFIVLDRARIEICQCICRPPYSGKSFLHKRAGQFKNWNVQWGGHFALWKKHLASFFHFSWDTKRITSKYNWEKTWKKVWALLNTKQDITNTLTLPIDKGCCTSIYCVHSLNTKTIHANLNSLNTFTKETGSSNLKLVLIM